MAHPYDQAHEMSIHERRQLFLKELVRAEENFAPGTEAVKYLNFFRWLQTNTDIFDPVMVRITLDSTDPGNRDVLRLDDEAIKDMVTTYLSGK